MIKNALILAGGFGTRLKEITKKTPKPLIDINGKPFIEYIINNLTNANIKKIYILTYYKSDKFFHKYHNKKISNSKIICIKEKKPLGTGGSIYNALKYISNNSIICNGDSFLDIDFSKLNKIQLKKKYIFIPLVHNTNYKSNKKLSNLNIKNKIINFSCKKNDLMNAGVYIVNRKIINYLKKGKNSFEENSIPKLIIENRCIGKVYNKYFIDIGIKKNLNLFRNHTKNKAVFFDRDGVLNEDKGYVYKINSFKWTSGAKRAISYLKKLNFKIIVITNQSGIGRGYYKTKDMYYLHDFMQKELKKIDASIDKFYFCPHHPRYGKGNYLRKCKCRKPNNELFLKAIKEYNVDVKKSFMIGDQITDKKASKKSKIKFFYKKKESLYKQIKNIIDNKK